MKKFIFIILLIIAIFFAGYRYGISKNNEYTISHMNNLATQQIAIRAIARITELGKIKTMFADNKELVCYITHSMPDLIKDIENCEMNHECANRIQGTYYLNAKATISNFLTEECL